MTRRERRATGRPQPVSRGRTLATDPGVEGEPEGDADAGDSCEEDARTETDPHWSTPTERERADEDERRERQRGGATPGDRARDRGAEITSACEHPGVKIVVDALDRCAVSCDGHTEEREQSPRAEPDRRDPRDVDGRRRHEVGQVDDDARRRRMPWGCGVQCPGGGLADLWGRTRTRVTGRHFGVRCVIGKLVGHPVLHQRPDRGSRHRVQLWHVIG